MFDEIMRSGRCRRYDREKTTENQASLTVKAFVHSGRQQFTFTVDKRVEHPRCDKTVVLEHGAVRDIHKMLGEQLKQYDKSYCSCCGG